jgi:hypothetical protein
MSTPSAANDAPQIEPTNSGRVHSRLCRIGVVTLAIGAVMAGGEFWLERNYQRRLVEMDEDLEDWRKNEPWKKNVTEVTEHLPSRYGWEAVHYEMFQTDYKILRKPLEYSHEKTVLLSRIEVMQPLKLCGGILFALGAVLSGAYYWRPDSPRRLRRNLRREQADQATEKLLQALPQMTEVGGDDRLS